MITVKNFSEVPDGYEGGVCLSGVKNLSTIFYVKDFIRYMEGGIGLFDFKKHRLNGPAVIFNNFDIKDEEYWIDNKELTKQQFFNHPLVIEYQLSSIEKL